MIPRTIRIVWRLKLGRWRLTYSRKLTERNLQLNHILLLDTSVEWVVIELKWWFGL